jgi:hypothetical protein
MYTIDLGRIKKQLSNILSFIEPAYIDAILQLHKKLAGKHIDWAVGGDLGEALRTVQVKPDCIEIITDKKGTSQIFLAVHGHDTKNVFFQTERYLRDAVLNGKEYALYLRSHYFKFSQGNITVKVFGDLQFRIGDGEWGDKLEFKPEYVYLVGAKTAVVPLQVKYQIYQSLGWADRAELISQVINRRPAMLG